MLQALFFLDFQSKSQKSFTVFI
uniref:Uncharacterized protein n=1 Tax=Anguilla anguilla TaxID=7936 RepID=A0A0E9S3W9_ANGAN